MTFWTQLGSQPWDILVSPIWAADPPGICQQSTVVWQVIHVVAVANGTSSGLAVGLAQNFLCKQCMQMYAV